MADAAQRLRANGLRVTRPRTAVLDVLDAAIAERQHLLVTDIVERARARSGPLSVQAVYDCLDALTHAQLVRRVETAGSAARFEARVGDNHHHLVCRGCGRIVDVDCATGVAPCLEPSDSQGFAVDEAEVVFWGRCAACSAQPQPGGRARRDPRHNKLTVVPNLTSHHEERKSHD